MVNDTDSTPQARWRHLVEEGNKTAANVGSDDNISAKPEWLDELRFAKGREAINKYFLGIQYSSLSGLFLILQLPDGLEPLLSTGQSRDIPSLYQRYLATILHVKSWYDYDVFDPQSKGYKSIRQVRAMHRRLQTNMNEKHQVLDQHGKSRVWFSNYDVAMTQFSFIGLAVLFPTKSGLIAASDEELELINYYWRVMGNLMGVRDDFNLCQFDKLPEIRQFYKLVFENEFKKNLETQPCTKGLKMTQSICTALAYFLPLLTFNGLANWWADCFSFNSYELKPLSTKEKLLAMWQRWSFNKFLKNEKMLRISTKLHRRQFDRRLKNREKILKQLKEAYKNDSQHTFYSDRCNYGLENKARNSEDFLGGCPLGFTSNPSSFNEPVKNMVAVSA